MNCIPFCIVTETPHFPLQLALQYYFPINIKRWPVSEHRYSPTSELVGSICSPSASSSELIRKAILCELLDDNDIVFLSQQSKESANMTISSRTCTNNASYSKRKERIFVREGNPTC